MNNADQRTVKTYLNNGYFGGRANVSGRNSPIRGIRYFDYSGVKKHHEAEIRHEEKNTKKS